MQAALQRQRSGPVLNGLPGLQGLVWAVLALAALSLPLSAAAQPTAASESQASAAAASATAAMATGAPPPLQVLSPPAGTTAVTAAQVHVMGRTLPGARVTVAGVAAQVFGSGVFVRDQVPLALGSNRITVQVQGPDGQTTQQTIELQRVAPPAAVQWPTDRLFINGATLQPAQTVLTRPGEAVEVAVHATPGQQVRARLPGQGWQNLAEASPGRYRGSLLFDGAADVAAAPVQIQLQAAHAGSAGRRGGAGPAAPQPRRITAQTPGSAGQWRTHPDRLWLVGDDGAALVHGLHGVRLGGPFLAELPAGTLLHITGQQGAYLRAQLSTDTEAWVATTAGRWAPAGTAPPRAHFTTLSVSGGAAGDVVQIPLPAGVPFAVRAMPSGSHVERSRLDPPSPRSNHHSSTADSAGSAGIEIDLYGTHHATTWVSHHATAHVVREVTAEQLSPGRVRLRITLQGLRLWGWRVERTAQALRVTVRPAPVLAAAGPALAGLRVALEAGHGGPNNLGAVGATGTPEKDFNRWTTQALQAELEQAGAQVLLVREDDSNPSLAERAQRAVAADAHVYISVHGNAAGVEGGYLRVSGTSTYYKHPHSRALAAAVQQQLLQATGLNDFGLVGNFNYAPIRLVTWMPAVLVEQAFVSHPGDEALLLEPAFRQRLAQAVRRGLEDFLRTP